MAFNASLAVLSFIPLQLVPVLGHANATTPKCAMCCQPLSHDGPIPAGPGLILPTARPPLHEAMLGTAELMKSRGKGKFLVRGTAYCPWTVNDISVP